MNENTTAPLAASSSTAPSTSPASSSPRSTALVVVGVVVGLVVAGIVLKVLIDKDREQCAAAYRKIGVEKVTYDAATNEWRIWIGGVVNLGAKIENWKATYGGKTYTSSDPEGSETIVSQYHRKPSRAGFLGSDFKKLYGASYKHYSFQFIILDDEKADPRATIEGVIQDGAGQGAVPFSVNVDLKK